MKKYGVFENEKACVIENTDWNKYIYDTFDKACEYADKWLGYYAMKNYELNVKHEYSGYGDYIMIKEI